MIRNVLFGETPAGKKIEKYILQNSSGMKVEVISYGAIITSIEVPDREGKFEDVVAGFDTLEGYLQAHPYFGAMVGRYANRIAGGKFVLDGNSYSLAINNEGNHIHGGVEGFDKKVWSITDSMDGDHPSVRFRYRSQHLEEGYPGELEVWYRITLTPENELRLDTEARTDRPTILNLTNHSYFNLSAFKENIYAHELQLNAAYYTELGPGSIPNGRIVPVKGTPLDFTRPKAIGKEIDQIPPGYDHNFVIKRRRKDMEKVAVVYDPLSGRLMKVFSTQPGVQLYTGNFLAGDLRGKQGMVYQKHAAFCLETQHFPDSPHHSRFPSVELREDEVYKQCTVFAFSNK